MDRKQNWRGNQQWNLEAESIRSRAESTGGSVELKTVTVIRWSSACDTFLALSVYLVLNSLLDWEPVDRLKQRNDVFKFYVVQHERDCLSIVYSIFLYLFLTVPSEGPHLTTVHSFARFLSSVALRPQKLGFGRFPFR